MSQTNGGRFQSFDVPTIAEAISEGAQVLREASVDEDRRTAAALLSHALLLDRAQLIIRSKEEITEPIYEEFIRLIRRRAAGEPLQYITGHQEFYGLDFEVNRDVLIPRPETEFLVERVIALARNLIAPVIADIGTGSGCIAVALAVNIPHARILATDISPSAIKVARANARLHRVEERIEFLTGDLLAPLAGREGAIDILASNPPYVPASRPDLVQREVREWEPDVALFGGEEGLDFYRRLLNEAVPFVKEGGWMVCEIGYSQLASIREMIGPEWNLVEVNSDLQAIPRTLTIRKSG
jgi:release factor glutamine methyltransferase